MSGVSLSDTVYSIDVKKNIDPKNKKTLKNMIFMKK